MCIGAMTLQRRKVSLVVKDIASGKDCNADP